MQGLVSFHENLADFCQFESSLRSLVSFSLFLVSVLCMSCRTETHEFQEPTRRWGKTTLNAMVLQQPLSFDGAAAGLKGGDQPSIDHEKLLFTEGPAGGANFIFREGETTIKVTLASWGGVASRRGATGGAQWFRGFNDI